MVSIAHVLLDAEGQHLYSWPLSPYSSSFLATYFLYLYALGNEANAMRTMLRPELTCSINGHTKCAVLVFLCYKATPCAQCCILTRPAASMGTQSALRWYSCVIKQRYAHNVAFWLDRQHQWAHKLRCVGMPVLWIRGACAHNRVLACLQETTHTEALGWICADKMGTYVCGPNGHIW
jgi:hypothetical protein